MNQPYFTCTNCNADYRDHGDFQEYPEVHTDPDKPKCIHCEQATLKWHVTTHDYAYQVWFDYAHQCYRTSDGRVVDTNQVECTDWDFPCSTCYGPAKIISISAHGEYHTCKNCNHSFTVS